MPGFQADVDTRVVAGQVAARRVDHPVVALFSLDDDHFGTVGVSLVLLRKMRSLELGRY